MAKLKTYHVMAELDLQVGIDIKATSMEDALQQARKLDEQSFVTIEGEYLDGHWSLYGIYKKE